MKHHTLVTFNLRLEADLSSADLNFLHFSVFLFPAEARLSELRTMVKSKTNDKNIKFKATSFS